MKLYTFNRSRFCDSTCSFCAREFFNWWKSRMAQMSVSLDGGTSFAEAAAHSISGNSTSQSVTVGHTPE